MRLSNKRKAPYYNFIHTLLLMIFFVGIIIFIFERYAYDILGLEEYLLITIPFLLLIIFYISGKQIFEFDSDGEGLTIKNRHVLPYFFPAISDEFPKYKLQSYNVVDAFILSRLYLKITSKKSSAIILKYDISYLTKKELGDLKFSLSKVISQNKKSKDFKSSEK